MYCICFIVHDRDIQVREAFEELCSVEDSWNNFLLQIDKHDGDVSTIPGDSTAHNILRLSLVDARSGRLHMKLVI
jgi:hypothetical protein